MVGSGIQKKPIPDPGSRGPKGTGSRIRIRNTDLNETKSSISRKYMYSAWCFVYSTCLTYPYRSRLLIRPFLRSLWMIFLCLDRAGWSGVHVDSAHQDALPCHLLPHAGCRGGRGKFSSFYPESWLQSFLFAGTDSRLRNSGS